MFKDKFMYQVMITCAPDLEDEFNKWFNEVHVPLVMKGGMLKAINRYRLTDATGADLPKYSIVCEFDDRAQFEKWWNSEELAAARRNTAEVMGGKDLVFVTKALYEPTNRFTA